MMNKKLDKLEKLSILPDIKVNIIVNENNNSINAKYKNVDSDDSDNEINVIKLYFYF